MSVRKLVIKAIGEFDNIKLLRALRSVSFAGFGLREARAVMELLNKSNQITLFDGLDSDEQNQCNKFLGSVENIELSWVESETKELLIIKPERKRKHSFFDILFS